MRTAFAKRWDYQNALLEMKKKKIELKMSHNNLFPQLDFEASYAANGLSAHSMDAVGKIFSFDNPTYEAGFKLSMPLEMRKERADYRRAKLAKEKSILEFKKLEDQVIVEVDDGFRRVEVTRKALSEAEAIEYLQEEKFEAEQKRFFSGRSNSKQIIDFQDDVITAKLNRLQARAEFQKAIDQLRRYQNQLLRTVQPNREESV